MNLSDINIRRTGRTAGLAAAMLCGLLGSSCDSSIYDDEGDCVPRYKVGFVYDRNMKWADAFPHEVEAVKLHLIDADGKVAAVFQESGERLDHAGYTMDVDVAPGRYTLMAWAGDKDGQSFEYGGDIYARGAYQVPFPDYKPGCENLTMRMRRQSLYGEAVSRENLSRLYHGVLADVDFPDGEGEHKVTVSLTKNTNYVKVVLQQMAGLPMDMKDLEVTITDDNGMMEWDNSLRQEETITYRPWNVKPIAASISPDSGDGDGLGTAATYTGLMAEFTTARLMEEHRETARLTVKYKGKTKFSVKLIDFLLMVKGEYNRAMSDQEYLDRQDAFDLVFFLDEGHEWTSTTIFINSWKVVLQNTKL